jgi:hypothetical protein
MSALLPKEPSAPGACPLSSHQQTSDRVHRIPSASTVEASALSGRSSGAAEGARGGNRKSETQPKRTLEDGALVVTAETPALMP